MLKNRREIRRFLEISTNEFVQDGPYFQKKTTKTKGCQIDLLIQCKYNTLYVCEIKFSKNSMGAEVISEVEKKISSLAIPKNFSVRPVLIYEGELAPVVLESQYFDKIVKFSELLGETGGIK